MIFQRLHQSRLTRITNNDVFEKIVIVVMDVSHLINFDIIKIMILRKLKKGLPKQQNI